MTASSALARGGCFMEGRWVRLGRSDYDKVSYVYDRMSYLSSDAALDILPADVLSVGDTP